LSDLDALLSPPSEASAGVTLSDTELSHSGLPKSESLTPIDTTYARPTLSIIIPVLNEAHTIARSLLQLKGMQAGGAEVIVVDGGSSDDSVEQAQMHADKVLHSGRGRARQMNVGARGASGQVLLFLHADTELPEIRVDLAELLAQKKAVWGRFDVRLSGANVAFRVIEFMINQRSRLTGIATGDQGLFIKRSVFTDLGGFKEIPLMEDIELCKRLKKITAPLCLKQRVVTSSRKWEREGVLKVVMLMWRLRLAYFFGVPAARLAKFY